MEETDDAGGKGIVGKRTVDGNLAVRDGSDFV